MARQDSKETTPDLFEEFGIAQDAEDVAITSDEMAEAFLEAVGMDGREPEPNDPNFWEKHDKKHHHGHFDPETQRCSLREEVEQAEKAKDKGDDIGAEQPNVAGLEAPEKRGAEEEKDTDWEKLDAEYMDAVKRGDMEKCTEMVRQAAAKAMPDTKVVDAKGNPEIVYHGTRNFGFSLFNKMGFNLVIGQFFTNSLPIAESYSGASGTSMIDEKYDPDGISRGLFHQIGGYEKGGNYSVFLNIQNPFIMDCKGYPFNNIKMEDGRRIDTDTLAREALQQGYDGVILRNVQDRGRYSDDSGDWIKRYNGSDFITFEPSQIKSADPVTYDDKGNVIPLSKRFQADNPDIRFSKEGGATSAWDATTRAEAEAAKEILEKCLFGTTVGFAEHEYQGDGEEESRASVVSPELDAEYMDAVERGDLEKCAKLVQEAAAKAGYTQEAWHYGDLALKNSSDYNIPSGETHYGTREAALDRLRNRADSGAHEWAGYKLFEKDGKWFWQFKSEFYNTEEEAMKDMTSGGPFATKEQAEDDMAKDYGGKLTKVYLNVDGARTVDEDDPKLQEGEDIVRYRNAQEDPGSYSFKVADPTRVKSAAPVTYDDDGNVIPLSRRFDQDSDDIRYAKTGSGYSLGAPYQGSKGRIASQIIDLLPEGSRFVDLFSGGGAMTHAAMLSGKFDSYRMNDISPKGQDLFLQGIRGEWNDYKRVGMTKESFEGVKGTPEGIIWSFNNKGNEFAGGEEGLKHARRNIERMKRLGELSDEADKVNASNLDYRQVEIRPGDVLYADIPYEGTNRRGYGSGSFDKEAFIKWAEGLEQPVFVSEHQMPDGWTEIGSWNVSGIRGRNPEEKLFVQDRFANRFLNGREQRREDPKMGIGGIFTGSGADYANRSRQGGIDDGPSLKHIGTGEGSQVYGWGLYGSNNREVASGYAAGSFKPGLEVDGKQLPSDLATTLIASALDYYKGDEAAALADIRDSFKSMTSGGEMKKALQSAIEILEKNPGKVKSITQYPNLYEQTWFTNRTAGDESHLLNWYVPSANIKEQLGWIRTQAEKEGILDKPNKTGGTLRQGLETAEHTIIGRTGQDLYYMVEGVVGGPRAASEFLSRAGIDGIKYPVDSYGGKSIKDGDEAGWNYVAFSDKNIRVDHKWVNGEQRYFRNGVGKVVGTYDRASGKITLYPGAKAKDVVHEFSHGLWQFAEQEAAAGRSTLMTKFRSIADSAPQAVKDAVKANYGTDNPNVYLEECFTHEMARQSEGDSAFARAIETPEGRPWYRRAWGVIKNTWNRFAASKKLANVDVSKMDRMDAAQSAKFILRQLAKGAHFGTVQHTGNGTRKSIIGVKGAERLGMGKLDEAQKMSKGGASRENIWRKTGWWRGKDGKWRVEVPDVILPFETLPSVAESKKAHRFLMQNLDKYDVSTIRQLEERAPEAYSQYAGMKRKVEDIERREASDQFTVRDFVQDTGLDMAYPELMKMPVRFKLQGSDIGLREHTGGYFDGKQIVIDRLSEPKQIRSHIAHELQHAIQDIEGFARGANGNIVDRSQYVRSAGEVESRNIQKRLDMTPEKRAAHPPWETEDVPEEKQIVMLSDKQGKTPDLFAEFGVTGDEAIDTTPDLFAVFGIAEQDSSSNKQESLPDLFAEFGITQGNQKSEDMRNALLEMVIRVLEEEPDDARPNLFSKKWAWKKSAIAGDEMADLFLEAVGMDGREPDPNDPDFWEKHDKIHHHGNFDPETQTCTLREEAENAEKEKDAGDDIGSEQPNVAGLESPSQRGAEESKQPKDKHQEVPKTDRTLSKTEAPKRIEGLSGKREKKYREMMAKKHPELDAEMVLTEIGKIEDKKIQEDAFKWVLKGAVKLPEDMYKVEQARELATKAKKDPFSWNTPQACINELLGLGHKVSLKPITIDELKKDPIFSDYRKLPEGVETFEVEDSREGQRRMREVIDTHWGKDANPWCLLARGSGDDLTDEAINRHAFEWYDYELSDKEKSKFDENADDFVEKVEAAFKKEKADEVALHRAWDYWNRYNALPKRVAFKDGKLLAFMATDSMDRDEAFDDAAYSSGSRLAEMYPDQYEEYEKWSETEVGKEEGANFYEWLEHEYPELSDEDALRNNVPEQWWDRDDEPHKGIPLGTIAVKSGSDERQIQAEMSSATGKIRYIGDAVSKKDGITTTWYGTSDRKRSEDYPDGSRKVWHPNGQIRMEERADGSREVFHEDGRPLEKVGADGSKKVWHPNGQIHTDRDSDGNQKVYDETGRLRIEERYDADAPFKMRKYDENGQMTKEILPDSTEREYVDGHLEKEYRSDGSTACFEPGGNKIWERLVDRTYREFDPESGKLTMESTPDGSWKRFSPDGEVIEEGFESR